jgi:hypothetical protein
MPWLKCDEARPSCSQCRRGGRKCPGYIRAMKFVDEGTKLRRSAHRQSAKTTCVNTSASEKMKGAPNKKESGPGDAVGTVFHRPRINQVPPQKHHRTQLLACFIADMFPIGVASVQRSFLGSWLWHIPPRLGCSAVLDYSALALALAYFGRGAEDRALIQDAELSYSMALTSLAAAIADKGRQFDADVLCAAMLLGNYEVVLTILKLLNPQNHP